MSSTKNKPTRRRGTELEKALLQAAWAELQAVGYDQLTFDGVASRAGTSKTVLYRRWANRLELTYAALRELQPLVHGRVPNTGSLRQDVIKLLQQMAAGLDERRLAISVGMLVDTLGNRGQRSYIQQAIHGSNLSAMEEIIQRAAERGEVKKTELPDRLLTLPLDLVRNELVMAGAPPTQAIIEQIVDELFLPLVGLSGS